MRDMEGLNLSHAGTLARYLRSPRYANATSGNLFNGAPQAGAIVTLISVASLVALVFACAR